MTQSISPHDLTTTMPAATPPLPPPSAAPVGFGVFDLTPPLLRALAEEGYTDPTPIQSQAIPHLLAGRDVLGCAQTGTGKTAAFALPILHRLARTTRPKKRGPRAWCWRPPASWRCRSAESFPTYGRHLSLSTTVVFGGVGQGPQVEALRAAASTSSWPPPGRLLDLMGAGTRPLRDVETLVLDEADRMLDMGFIDPIRRIIAVLPRAPPDPDVLGHHAGATSPSWPIRSCVNPARSR